MKFIKMLLSVIVVCTISACHSKPENVETRSTFTRLNATEADSIGLNDWNIEFEPFMEEDKWFFDLSLSYKGTDTVSKLRLNILEYESERETDFSKGLKWKRVPLDSSSNELRIDMIWYIDDKEHQGMKKYDLVWNP